MAVKGWHKRRKYIKMLVLPKVLWGSAWERAPRAKMFWLRNRIETCVRVLWPGRGLGTRSRFLAWSVSVGAAVCPFYYAAQNVLRVERWRRSREGGATTWAIARDPMALIKELWGWEYEGEGVYSTADGRLNLLEDG